MRREQSDSRRNFIKFVGQIVTGASVAGIGIGLTQNRNALAEPNCVPCTGCVVLSCTYSGTCRARYPQYPYEIIYGQYDGCDASGCTYTYTYNKCNSACSCKGGA